MLYVLIALSFLSHAECEFRISCYFSNLAQYRPNAGKFLPESIVAHQCTHIVYAIAQPKGLGLTHTDANDLPHDDQSGMYRSVILLKKKHPDLKVLLGLASSNTAHNPYSAIVSTPVSRSAFAQNAVVFLRKYRFDGLEVAWRYPDVHSIPIINKDKFVLLFKELMDIFVVDSSMRNVARLLLSAVLPGIIEDIQSGYDIKGILQYTDFISLMTFNYFYKINDTVRMSTPFHSNSSDPLSLDAIVRYLTVTKLPMEKINFGISLAARTYTLESPAQPHLGAKAAGPGSPGPFTDTVGSMAYYEICAIIYAGGTVFNDEHDDSSYVVRDKFWASYEDVRSVIAKACFAIDNHFGGVMIRSLDLDDFNGTFCGQGKFPLVAGITSVVKEDSCRKYTHTFHVHSGQSQTITCLPGWTFLLVSFCILGLSFI